MAVVVLVAVPMAVVAVPVGRRRKHCKSGGSGGNTSRIRSSSR